MSLTRYLLLLVFTCFVYTAHAQLQPGTRRDSIAQARVLELVEAEHVLGYYDENLNTPGDFIYSSQVSTSIKQKPGKDFADYWVQVIDHRRYDGPSTYINFFVDPKSWEVYYYDTNTDQLWSWANWKKQAGYKKPAYQLYYPNI